MANLVYLSLGSNLGSRHRNLQHAVDALGDVAAIEAISPVYETAPWGYADQPNYLNICLEARTLLDPGSLLSACKEIERKLGRKPVRKWGPRLIDIDLIFFNDRIIDNETLSIPHLEIDQRAFVLAPLADIAAEKVNPRSGSTVARMLANIDPTTVERLTDPKYRLNKPAVFAWGVKTYVMGILNVTLDSFSGDGLLQGDDLVSKAVQQAITFVEAGADVIDVGGESTRPGSQPISVKEETTRVIPVIDALKRAIDVPLSLDTYRASVAKAGLEVGARWINDVWGLRMDPSMAEVVAKTGCPIVIMHNRSKPKDVNQRERLGGRYVGVEYDDLIEDIRNELEESVRYALDAGISKRRIILDPGIGFGKTVTQNLRLINELDRLLELGFPILVGPSRKSFIGYTLNLPPDQRIEGTAAAVSIAIDRGADVIRVHDVQAMARVSRMADHIVRS